jgi:DNA repair protein RecO (recombination protein O)
MRIALQPAFVLHSRPYRETSVIVDLLTQDCGRITAVARGVRQSRSQLRPLLQLFMPLFVSWQGKSELMTLLTVEANGYSRRLTGERLLSGLYLNEMLMRVLHKHDPHPALYTIYHNTLIELQGTEPQLKTLRLFEKKLLEQLGYGLHLTYDVANQSAIVANHHYRFHPEHGFEFCGLNAGQHNVFSGKSLLALEAEELDDDTCLRDAKRLMRLALAPLLGKFTLNSRQLYSQPREIQIEEVQTE